MFYSRKRNIHLGAKGLKYGLLIGSILWLFSFGWQVIATLTGDSCRLYQNTITEQEQTENNFIDIIPENWTFINEICKRVEPDQNENIPVNNSISSTLSHITIKNKSDNKRFVPFKTQNSLNSFLSAIQNSDSPLYKNSNSGYELCATDLLNTQNTNIVINGGNVSISGCDDPDGENANDACDNEVSFVDTRDNTTYSIVPIDGTCWMEQDYNFWWNIFSDFNTNDDAYLYYDTINSSNSVFDGTTIPNKLKTICNTFFPKNLYPIEIFYYEIDSAYLQCTYENGASEDLIVKLPKSAYGNDYNGIPTPENIYRPHADDMTILSENFCPTGWRLPNKSEMETAFSSLPNINAGALILAPAKWSYQSDVTAYFAWGEAYNTWSDNLGHYQGTQYQGRLIGGRTRCVKGTEVPEWGTGSWGTCSANNAYPTGIQYRSVNCKIAGETILDSNCLTTKPIQLNYPCALPTPAPTGTSSSSG